MTSPVTVLVCPQCGADTHAAGPRCPDCGFVLAATPAPRVGPQTARRVPRPKKHPPFLALGVAGGLLLAGSLAGTAIARRPAATPAAPPARASASSVSSSSDQAPRLEPNGLLPEGRRLSSAVYGDALLVAIDAGPVDDHGVSPSGAIELTYAEPEGRQIKPGSATSGATLRVLWSSFGAKAQVSEARGSKGHSVPEPNCLFEAALASARRSGAGAPGSRLRYEWSQTYLRAVWLARDEGGTTSRTIDGVTCAIVARSSAAP